MGVTPGATGGNKSKWDRITQGDVTLLASEGRVFASATTTYKTHNVDLAKHLWGVDKKNQTWEYIYFVSEVTKLDIPYAELNAVIPYAENYIIRAFSVLNEEKSNNVLSAFNLFSETYYPDIDLSAYLKLLHEEDSLDSKSLSYSRREQATLRRILFENKSNAACCICQQSYPVKFLVAAHIKMRSRCTLIEKKDFKNIVAPMCKFGCDELYEKGYIGVVNSYVKSLQKEPSTDVIASYIKNIIGNQCSYWGETTEEYFNWHASRHVHN